MIGPLFFGILLAAQMPEMDGLILIEYMSSGLKWKSATLMMLSFAGQGGDARRCRVGVAAYLTKPLRQGEFLDAILTALGTKPMQEAPLWLRTEKIALESG